MKKIIFAICLFLLSAHLAFAALTVKGHVPVVSPLQPLPIGASPSLNQNIEFKSPQYSEPSATASNLPNAQTTENSGQNSAKPGALNGSGVSRAFQSSLAWWLLFVAAILGFVWWALRRKA